MAVAKYPMTTLNDDILGAYADSELDAATTRQVEAELSENDAARRRLSAIQRATDLSQASFAEVSREPVPDRLLDFLVPSNTTRTWKVIFGARPVWRRTLSAAVGLAVLLIGIIIGTQFSPWGSLLPDMAQRPYAWRDQAVYFHSIYEDTQGSERQALVDFAGDDREALVSWFSGVLGPEVRVPELEHEDFRLHGGRLLIAGRQPMVKLMYITNDQRILSLAVMKDSVQQQEFIFEEVNGRNTLLWADRTYVFMLVGKLDRESLLRIGEQIAIGFRPDLQ